MNVVALKRETDAGSLMESVLIKGDLAQLTAEERSTYYLKVCDSIGLNPMTQPLQYIVLNGRLTLYARRDAADQLRKINGISIEIVKQATENDLLIVHVRAKDKSGREDADEGFASMLYPSHYKDRNGRLIDHPKAGKALDGEDRGNAILKAITKAKRRVTLSISGLGFLDETEIEDIPASSKAPPVAVSAEVVATAAEPTSTPTHDPETGEFGPRALKVPSGPNGPNFIAFGQAYIVAIDAAAAKDELHQWEELNAATLAEIKAKAPKIYDRLVARMQMAAKKFYVIPEEPPIVQSVDPEVPPATVRLRHPAAA